jgi:hypothetical protein
MGLIQRYPVRVVVLAHEITSRVVVVGHVSLEPLASLPVGVLVEPDPVRHDWRYTPAGYPVPEADGPRQGRPTGTADASPAMWSPRHGTSPCKLLQQSLMGGFERQKP